MNTRHRVNFASQGSIGSDTLASLRLRNNEPTSTNIYHRLAISIAVICWLVLGHHPPDDYTGKGYAVHRDDRNGFGKRVVVGVHFNQLRADEMLLPAEDGNPQTIEVGVRIIKNGLDVRL